MVPAHWSSHSTRYPNVPVDRDATIALIHGLQVDLSLLAAMLVREPEPALHFMGIDRLAFLRQSIHAYIPETRRQ